MHKIMKYLQMRDIPGDEKHAYKVHLYVTHFTLINDNLYRRSFREP